MVFKKNNVPVKFNPGTQTTICLWNSIEYINGKY